mgnify:CR=1 FL=1
MTTNVKQVVYYAFSALDQTIGYVEFYRYLRRLVAI